MPQQQDPITLDIERPNHWAAIQSIPRMAVLGRLLSEGPHTITELAAHFGRSHQSMAYHVRVLESAGLVEETGEERVTGKRPAAEFCAALGAKKARIYVNPTSELGMHRFRANVLAVARYANDAFVENVEADLEQGGSGEGAMLNCAMMTVPAADAARIERLMREVSDVIDAARQRSCSAAEGGVPLLAGLWLARDLVGRGPVADFELTHAPNAKP